MWNRAAPAISATKVVGAGDHTVRIEAQKMNF